MTRTATAIRAVPQTRSPERERLAAAIENHKNAVARLQELEAAKGTALEAIFAASRARDAAEEQLQKARGAEQDQLVDSLLDQQQETGDPVAVAVQALEAAQRRYDTSKRAEAALREEVDRSGAALRWARTELNEAVRAVVRGSSEIQELIRAHDQALVRLDSLRRAMEAVGILAMPAEGQGWDVVNRIEYRKLPCDPRPAAAWHEALRALQSDPDAELPT